MNTNDYIREMTVDELRQKKAELEKEINALLKKFKKETGVRVSYMYETYENTTDNWAVNLDID